ncbi:MAG TPA: GNAT family N-acetyltransferase [Epulopiscium sp.]|nr:GNAT family N-acetyltransferase [Candidatus Epulonipiscium sp.]
MIDYKNIMKENDRLESDRLFLRPFCIEDAKDVFCYANNDDVTRYLTWESHTDLSESEKVLKEFYMNDTGIYAIELKSEHKCIGCIDLRLDIENSKGSFGYVMNKNYWGQGYMPESLNAVLDFAFTKLSLNRIESTYYVGNEASGRVMKKCGMQYEGIGLQEVKVKGIYYDVVHYAILKQNWIDLKNKLTSRGLNR